MSSANALSTSGSAIVTRVSLGLCCPLDPTPSYYDTVSVTRKKESVEWRNIHFNLDTQYTLSEHDMSDSLINKVAGRLARVDHEPVGEPHRFGTGGAQLAGNDDFAALCAGLHDEAEDTVRRTVITKILPRKTSRDLVSPRDLGADGEGEGRGTHRRTVRLSEELVMQRSTLCNAGEAAVEDLFGVPLGGPFGELEPLLDERREPENTPSLLS